MGAFRNHGEETNVGLVGKTIKNPGHVVLLVVRDSKTYELSFRLNRGNEAPTIEALAPDSLSEERLKWVEPIDEAFFRYGQELDDRAIYNLSFDTCISGPGDSDADQVAFDDNF